MKVIAPPSPLTSLTRDFAVEFRRKPDAGRPAQDRSPPRYPALCCVVHDALTDPRSLGRMRRARPATNIMPTTIQTAPATAMNAYMADELSHRIEKVPVQIPRATIRATPSPDCDGRPCPRRRAGLGFRTRRGGCRLQTAAVAGGVRLTEIDAYFRKSGRGIIPLTVHEILDEQLARKLV